MEIDRDNLAGIYLNPTGGGGGGGGTDAHVTTTQTNPVIPDAAKPLFNSMMGIATAGLGSPVNYGSIPGVDAPATRMPTANLGSLLTSPAFMAGANRQSPLSVAPGPIRPPNSGGGYTTPNYNPSGTPTVITEPTKEFTTRREQRQNNRDIRRERRIDRRMGLGDMLAA